MKDSVVCTKFSINGYHFSNTAVVFDPDKHLPPDPDGEKYDKACDDSEGNKKGTGNTHEDDAKFDYDNKNGNRFNSDQDENCSIDSDDDDSEYSDDEKVACDTNNPPSKQSLWTLCRRKRRAQPMNQSGHCLHK
jgi:hypothetical protein